jgi:hypothetical protein
MSMADESGQAKTDFDELLDEMPRIAEVVKTFPEAVQPQAFEALMAEARGRRSSGAGESDTKTRRRTKPRATKADGDGKVARRSKRKPSAVRSLDLAPKGKTSFKDFVAEKQPKTNHDRNTVSVYYLAEELGMSGVTLEHVFTCYRDMGWREPSDLANSLSLTAYHKRFLDTADMENITVTAPGRNHVKHDLPAPKKG